VDATLKLGFDYRSPEIPTILLKSQADDIKNCIKGMVDSGLIDNYFNAAGREG
jgi:hypothetical protein